jgi:hypothetical protein
MTQPPFPGNDFFDQIDSVARNLTGNAYRLKRDDPTAPQKFTEFIAQSEQEFNATQPQAAPQSFRGFEQDGFRQPQTAQPTQAVDVQRPDPTSLSGAFFNYNPLGQAIRGIGRAHAPAGERILKGLSGLERFAQAQVLDEALLQAELFGVGDEVKEQFPYLKEYEAAKEAQREIDRAGGFTEKAGRRFNILGSEGARALSDPKWREEATQLPVHLPFVAEGRSPAFHLSALDVVGATLDPTNIVAVGPGTKIAKELRQLVPYLPTLEKPARRTVGQVLQEGGQSLVEEFAPVTRKVEETARATGREALRQAERMPGGIPGVPRFADEPIVPPRGGGGGLRSLSDTELQSVRNEFERLTEMPGLISPDEAFKQIDELTAQVPDFQRKELFETELRLVNADQKELTQKLLGVVDENTAQRMTIDFLAGSTENIEHLTLDQVEGMLQHMGGQVGELQEIYSRNIRINAVIKEHLVSRVDDITKRELVDTATIDAGQLPPAAARQADVAARGAGGVQGVGTELLPRNQDGTVTLFHGTTPEGGRSIRESGTLIGEENGVFLTTDRDAALTFGNEIVEVKVNPARLIIDDEFPTGRQDFRIPAQIGEPVEVGIIQAPTTPARQADVAADLPVTDPATGRVLSIAEQAEIARQRGLAPKAAPARTVDEISREIDDVTSELDELNIQIQERGLEPKIYRPPELSGVTDETILNFVEARRAAGETINPYDRDWWRNLDVEPEEIASIRGGFYGTSRSQTRQGQPRNITALRKERTRLRQDLKALREELDSVAPDVTPEQQAIIDDVGTGRPAGDLDVGAAAPVVRAVDLPSDVTGGIPPNRVIVEPPSTGGVSGSLFEPVQKFQTQMDITFNPNVSRMIGEQLRKTGVGRVLTGFDPSLAAKTPGQRSVIVYANLLDEATNKALRVTSHFDELGTRAEVFGSPIDDMGVFTEGTFAGRALNEVASLPVLRSKATPAQAEYLNRLTRVDKEASEFIRVHGSRDVGFVDETKEFFSARRIWARVDPQTGEVIKTVPAPNRHVGLGTKTSSEKARVVAEIEDLVADGFVLMPYDETVRLKVKQAMRSNAENEWIEWAKTNYKMEERPPGKQDYVRAQERLFQKYVGGDAEARAMIRDAEKALEVFLRQAPTGFVATSAKLVANVGMSLSLAGDASIFLIHYLRLLGWDALPVTAATGLKMPFGTTARSSTAFARQFSRALMSPKKSSAFSQHVISQNAEELRDARTLMLFASEELPELGEGFKGLRRVDDILGELPRFKRYAAFPARVPVRIIVAANEALSAAMNASGIYLFKALKPLAKNADGTINSQRLQDVEDFINNIRGVSSSARLGSSPSRRYNEGMALLAPRLRRASGALSSQIIEGGLRGTLARDALAGLFAGTALAFYGLVIGRGKADGKSDAQISHELEETLIPGGSTYMLAEVHGQMVGPGGKELQDIRILSKIMKSPESFLDGNLQTNPLIRWARSQGSIPLSGATDFIMGRDVVGRVTRPGQPVGGGKSTPFKEGMIGLAKNMGGRAIFLWLQSAVMEPGTLRGRAVRGVADFFGMRAFEEGRFQNLQNAAWEKHNKPLDELDQLERYHLEKDPEWGDQLLLLDEGRADDGDKFAGYRVERSDLEQVAFDRSSDFLVEMITALSKGGPDGTKGKDGGRDNPNAWSVLNTFARNIGEVKGTLSTQLDQYRHDHELTGYVGDEPKNEFDRMLNKWYELLDAHTEKVTSPRGREVQHKLNFDTWIPAADEFIAALSPELQGRLQEWRDRKQEPLGIDAILEARRPNAELYDLDDEGNAKMPNNEQLFNAVVRILAHELGWTKEDFIALRESE